MGMYIAIGKTTGWTLSTGIFEIIVESTREQFLADERGCLISIYRTYDDEGQSFIVLDDIDSNCFNLFYKHCEAAMDKFANYDNVKLTMNVEFILEQWLQVLKLMREDSRYSP